MNARKINEKDQNKFVSEIKLSESKKRLLRESNQRVDFRKQLEITKSNKKLAVKLFALKSNYRKFEMEKSFDKF